jgi:hypothetical protein
VCSLRRILQLLEDTPVVAAQLVGEAMRLEPLVPEPLMKLLISHPVCALEADAATTTAASPTASMVLSSSSSSLKAASLQAEDRATLRTPPTPITPSADPQQQQQQQQQYQHSHHPPARVVSSDSDMECNGKSSSRDLLEHPIDSCVERKAQRTVFTLAENSSSASVSPVLEAECGTAVGAPSAEK